MSDDLISKIDFFKKCKDVKQDFSGYSSALRYICEKDNKKYFIKIYDGNNLEQIKEIEVIYENLDIPTAKIIQVKYLNDLDKTFVVYEYIDGKELIDLTRKLSVEEIENIGLQVGENL